MGLVLRRRAARRFPSPTDNGASRDSCDFKNKNSTEFTGWNSKSVLLLKAVKA
jgi:hypothetical protein